MQPRLSTLVALGLAVLTMVRSVPARATPAQKLAQARQAFQLGDYEQAIPLLSYLLYPNVQLSRKSDLIEAHLMLGVAHFERGNLTRAGQEIEEALFLDSDITLDALLFSQRAIAFFDQRKAEFIERARRDAEARAEAEARQKLKELLENTIVIERRPYFINFIPFGAGQFQNGHNGKGILFFVSEAALCGASFGVFTYLVTQYGFNGRVPIEEAQTARRLQQVEIATGALCLAVMGGGIVDALMNYESTTRVPADESLLPDELKPEAPQNGDDGEKSRPKATSWFRLVPTLGPESLALAITWEF